MIHLIIFVLAFTSNSIACDIGFLDKETGKTFKAKSKEHVQSIKKSTSLIVWLKVAKEEDGYLFFEVREVIKGYFPFSKIAFSKNGTKGPSFQLIKANKEEQLVGTYSNHKNFDYSRQRAIDCTLPPFTVKIDRSYIYFFGDNSEFTFEQVESKEDNIYKALKGL